MVFDEEAINYVRRIISNKNIMKKAAKKIINFFSFKKLIRKSSRDLLICRTVDQGSLCWTNII